MTPDESFARWSERETGPLVPSIDEGRTKPVLIERATATRDESVSPRRVPDWTDGVVSFLDRLDSLDLTDDANRPGTRDHVVDRRLSWPIYFTDPDGNRVGLTTNAPRPGWIDTAG